MKKIWYSAKGKPYPENEPAYYDVDHFPKLQEIEKRWPEIKPELESFIKEKDRNFEANAYQGIKIEGAWNSLTFMFWGFYMASELYKKCPVLASHLKQVEGLVSLSFSRLAPHSSIARHRGDTNASIRCHIGIEVPAGLPACGIKVNETEKGWEEGKWTLFNDACIHSAWNHSDKRRVVLIMDIICPEFLKKKNSVCAHIIAYLLISNKLSNAVTLKYFSFFYKNILFPPVYLSMLAYRPFRNLTRRMF